MAANRASFTSEVKKTLYTILPDHVSPCGSKIDWPIVADALKTRSGTEIPWLSIKNWFAYAKEKHKAWNELKQWTGIGWKENGCPDIDVNSEKWKAFHKVLGDCVLNSFNCSIMCERIYCFCNVILLQRYKAIAKGFLKHPLPDEEEWDKILRSGYATGERSYTPSSVAQKQKEVVTVAEGECEESGDSDNVQEFQQVEEVRTQELEIVHTEPKKRRSVETKSQPSKKSSKSSREEDIDTCLYQMKKSSASLSSKQFNSFDEVQNKLESMGIVEKYGDEFVVDILDSFRRTPGAVELFNSLRSDAARLHFLRKHCFLDDDDDVYRPDMPMDEDPFI